MTLQELRRALQALPDSATLTLSVSELRGVVVQDSELATRHPAKRVAVPVKEYAHRRTQPPQDINVPVTIGESYQAGLVRRLAEYWIKHREVAAEMRISETQFSRWVGRPSSDTGRPVSIGIDNVIKIELAIVLVAVHSAGLAFAEAPEHMHIENPALLVGLAANGCQADVPPGPIVSQHTLPPVSSALSTRDVASR